MNNEFNIITPKGNIPVYTRDGFYNNSCMPSSIHKHSKAEFHVVLGHSVSYTIDNTNLELPYACVLYIPAGTMHCCSKTSEDVQCCAFETDYKLGDFQIFNIDPDILSSFFKEIKKLSQSNDHSVVASYISLIFSIIDNNALTPKFIDDYSFLIDDFFETKYSHDVSLSDLAKILHLSERQTQRVVVSHTGSTFSQQLTNKRLEIANMLMKNTNMTLTEIALKVGYKSYVGFWKALNKENK